jgi:hypothetical protein
MNYIPGNKLIYRDGKPQRTKEWLEKDTKSAKAVKEDLWEVFSEIRANIKADTSRVLKEKQTASGKTLEEVVKLAASIRTADTKDFDTHIIGIWAELFFSVVRSMGPNDSARVIFEDWFSHFLKGIEESKDEYDGFIDFPGFKLRYEVKGLRPQAHTETYSKGMFEETNEFYPDTVITIEVAGIPEPRQLVGVVWDKTDISQPYVTLTFKNIKDYFEQLRYEGLGSPKAIKGRHHKSKYTRGSYIDHTEEQVKTEFTGRQQVFTDYLEDRGITEAFKRWRLPKEYKPKSLKPRKFTL